MSKMLIRSNTRSSLRLEHNGENSFNGAIAADKAVVRSATASVLGDITNIANAGAGKASFSKPIKASVAAPYSSQPLKACVAAAPFSARPPLPEPPRSTPQTQKHFDRVLSEDVDMENPQCVGEYVEDIYAHLRSEETLDLPLSGYLEHQTEINSRMRAILVDWLVEVHMKYKLKNETLFLSIGIIDRFLTRRRVARKRLQLIGVTATLIASKYEEIYPPEIRDLIYICDKAYTKDEIINMEIEVLTTLDFNICFPTAVQFLDRFATINGCSETHRQVCQYLVELALPELKMIRHAPSHIAAAAVLLSNKLLKRSPCWPSAMEGHTGYTEMAVRNCAKELCTLLEGVGASSLQAVRKKFSHTKYNSVAKMTF